MGRDGKRRERNINQEFSSQRWRGKRESESKVGSSKPEASSLQGLGMERKWVKQPEMKGVGGQVLWGTEQRTEGKQAATTQGRACADTTEVTSIARSSNISRESGDLIFV